MRVCKVEWQRLWQSPGLPIGVIILTAAGILSSFEAAAYVRVSMAYDRNVNFLLVFQVILRSDLFTAAIPLICPFAYAAVYLEEQKSRFAVYSVPRCGLKPYLCSKLLIVAVSGAISVFASLFLVFFYSAMSVGSMNAPGMWNALLQSLPSYCLGGCLFAVTGGCFATAMKNKYMAYASPFILYYILTAFQSRYFQKAYILSPKEWMTARSLDRSVGIAVLTVLLCITGAGYVIAMRKRIRNE